MRIRSTKPEFWRSKTIAQLDYFTRLVLKALEAYVDDNGVGKDPIESVVIFCADAFPHDLARDPSSICTQVTHSLRTLCERNLAVRYSIDGEPFIYVRRWKQWQYIDRPNKGRHPRPDGTLEYKDTVNETIGAGQGVTDPMAPSDLREPCPQVAHNVPPTCPQNQSGEQGNRGTGEQNPPTPLDDEAAAPEPYRGRRTGVEIARAKFARIATSGSELARAIVAQYSDCLDTPIDATTAREITQSVDRCIQAGQSAEAIAAGIEDWAKSDSFSPNQIPKYVTKAAARRRGNNGVGKPTLKAAATGQLAEELIAEMGTE